MGTPPLSAATFTSYEDQVKAIPLHRFPPSLREEISSLLSSTRMCADRESSHIADDDCWAEQWESLYWEGLSDGAQYVPFGSDVREQVMHALPELFHPWPSYLDADELKCRYEINFDYDEDMPSDEGDTFFEIHMEYIIDVLSIVSTTKSACRATIALHPETGGAVREIIYPFEDPTFGYDSLPKPF
jgi:hypothetical protein